MATLIISLYYDILLILALDYVHLEAGCILKCIKHLCRHGSVLQIRYYTKTKYYSVCLFIYTVSQMEKK